jgi:hypothetical protein
LAGAVTMAVGSVMRPPSGVTVAQKLGLPELSEGKHTPS